MFDRLIKNWKTTMTAVIPAIVLVFGWIGFDIDPKELGTLAAGFYAIVLLFSRDRDK